MLVGAAELWEGWQEVPVLNPIWRGLRCERIRLVATLVHQVQKLCTVGLDGGSKFIKGSGLGEVRGWFECSLEVGFSQQVCYRAFRSTQPLVSVVGGEIVWHACDNRDPRVPTLGRFDSSFTQLPVRILSLPLIHYLEPWYFRGLGDRWAVVLELVLFRPLFLRRYWSGYGFLFAVAFLTGSTVRWLTNILLLLNRFRDGWQKIIIQLALVVRAWWSSCTKFPTPIQAPSGRLLRRLCRSWLRVIRTGLCIVVTCRHQFRRMFANTYNAPDWIINDTMLLN